MSRLANWIGGLLQLLESLGWSPRLAQEADRILSSVEPEELLELEDIFHRLTEYGFQEFNKVVPGQVTLLARDDRCRISVLGLLSFHRNGYVRHEAVRLLADEHSGKELRYLIIRQNDWVKPVAAEAWGAVQERLVPSYLPEFVRALPLVVRLLQYTRYDHLATVQAVVALLCRDDQSALLTRVVRSSHRPSRRLVLRFALQRAGDHWRRVLDSGLKSDDAVLRLWCCRSVPSVYAGEELKQILLALRRDSSMPVRRQALRIDSEQFPESARSVWGGALLDPNVAIRDLARFELKRLGTFDAATFYRRELARSPHSVPALRGLGETGEAADVPVLRHYLGSSLPRERRAALAGIASLGAEAAVPDFLRCLSDDSPALVREVVKVSRRWVHLMPAKELFDLASEDRPWHVRKSACRLIFEMGKWKSLPWLIRLVAGKDQRVAALAESLAQAWFSFPRSTRVFTTLEAFDRQAIESALEACEPRLSTDFVTKVRDWLSR
jgi:HEAT repeat protein